MAALLVSGLLWGTSWIAFKHFATHGLTGLTVTLATYGLVGAIALPMLWHQRQRWRAHWRHVVAAGVFGGLANACFVTALMFGEVTRAMLLFYLVPVWAVLGGRLFLGERITPSRSAAVALSIGGAVLVLGGPQVLASTPRLLDLLALSAGLFFSAQNIALRACGDVPILPKTLMAFAGCTLVSALALPFSGHAMPPLTGPVVLQLALFAAVWLTVAMATQSYGVTHLDAGRTGVLVLFELVAAVVSAMVVGGERLTALGWAGAALIVGAALVEARPARPSPRTRGEPA